MNGEHRAELFEQFVDGLPFGVLIVGDDRAAVCWNRRAEAITGYRRHEVLGHPCSELSLLRCGRPGVTCAGERCPLQEDQAGGEATFEHKDGHGVELMLQALALDKAGKSPPAAVIFQEKSAAREMRLWTTQGQTQWDDEYGLPLAAETRKELESTLPRADTAVLLLALEDAERLAKHFGRELVHTVMRKLIRSLSRAITVPHFLGHWGEHRLLLIIPHCDGGSLAQLVQSVETASARFGIRWWGDQIEPGIRVRGVSSVADESAQQMLQRLEDSFGAEPERE